VAGGLFDRDEIHSALTEVARILHGRGVRARILVYGGAALGLVYDPERDATRDVDGAFGTSAPEIRAAAAAVARARGYPADWLNDAAKIFLPVHGDPEFRPVIRVGEVEIAVAPPDLLLAMKLRAARGRRDLDDIEILIRVCGVDAVQAAVELFEGYFPDDALPARALEALTHWLGEDLNKPRRGRPTSRWW
jgi:hypothetical protein